MAKIKHHPEAGPGIDAYLAGLPAWSAGICHRLRNIIQKADPAMIEDWKWGPNYYREGMVCGFYATQKFVSLMFFRGVELSDPKQILRSNEGTVNNRHLRFTAIAQIDEDTLLEYIMEAIDLNLAGPVPKAAVASREVLLPADIEQAFKAAGVWAHYEEMSYYKRKEFKDWISWAKREDTRRKRILEAIGYLSRKEGWGDRYRKKK